MSSFVGRIIVGTLSLLILAAAGIFWLTGPPEEGVALRYYGMCCRVGPVLFFTWLAWKPLEKWPRWALVGLPIVLVAMLVNRFLLLVAIPLAFFVAMLSYPLKSKKKRRK